MKVYVFPADMHGCGYYRLIWPAMALKAQGHDIKIIHPKHPQRVMGELDSDGKLQSVSAPDDADVLVFQRVTSKIIMQAIPIWRANGIAVVFDVDDDMAAISASNPAFQMLHPKSQGDNVEEYSWIAAAKNYDLCTYVTVSTDTLLKRYASHGRGKVLHNRVPAFATEFSRDNAMPGVVGWGGVLMTHADDPQVVGPAISKLQREGYDFAVIGPEDGIRKSFGLERDLAFSGGVPIADYYKSINKLSVGIAPLVDTRFNQAKSWLKMLEYAAVGVPSVGSPRQEYQLLHSYGIGRLAEKPKDWYRELKKFLSDDIYREDMSAQGRQIVIDNFLVEDNAWRHWEAWTEAYEIQRKLPVTGGRREFTRPNFSKPKSPFGAH